MSDRMIDLLESFKGIPVVKKGEYDYFVHPLSDGIPLVGPEILQNSAILMAELIPEGTEYNVLVTAEAMGIPLTAGISMLTGKPFNIVRKRDYGIKGEIELAQSTGYSRGALYINIPVNAGSCVIIDDVLSRGGTLRSMTEGIRESGNDPLGAVILVDKMGAEGRKSMEEELDIWIRPLLYVDIIDGVCTARPTEFVR
ncbi:MAG: adenine phosphoribosyltransferase [Thermoplasmatota archaeon]